MLYLTIKALHIVAVIIWTGSLFLLTLVTAKTPLDQSAMRTARRVTDAAIGLTWLAGLTLAVSGNWYLSTWWQIKLALVIAISAIHSIVHRRWQRLSETGARTHPAIPWVLLVITMIVVALATFKLPG